MSTEDERISEAIVRLETDSEVVRDFVNGPADETVETEGGVLPTLAKLIVDLTDQVGGVTTEVVEAATTAALHSQLAVESAQTAAEQATIAQETALEVAQGTNNAFEAADISKAEADRATVAAIQSETARDTFNLNVGRKPDVATGILEVLVGQSFTVLSPDSNQFIIEYLKESETTAIEVKSYPSAEVVTKIDARLQVAEVEFEPVAGAVQPDKYISEKLALFIDANNQIFGSVRKDASWDILLRNLSTASGLSIFEYEALGFDGEAVVVDPDGSILTVFGAEGEPTDDGLSVFEYEAIRGGAEVVFVDSNDKVIATVGPDDDSSGEEVIIARGSRNTLDSRISQSLNPYGMPKRHVWGEWYLRETRQRLRKRALAESTQLTIAIIGDSWTHYAERYTKALAATLKASYGSAGDGWVGFGRANANLPNGNVNWSGAVTYTGSWDGNYAVSYSPDICEIFSSEPGASLKYTISTSTSAVNLFAKGGGGVVRYRWGSGAWTTIDLSILANSLQIIALADVPATSSAIEIAVVSGTPVLFGLDVKSVADGVRCHKLGATGSRSQQWATVDQVQWVAGITSLAPNLFIIMHGTNDQAAYTPMAYQDYMRTLIARCRLANPLADVLLIIPCENGRNNLRPMSGFAEMLYELAVEQKCSFIDLQYVFGDDFSEYSSVSPRNWFNADLIHPEPSTGGRAIVDAVLRLITQL